MISFFFHYHTIVECVGTKAIHVLILRDFLHINFFNWYNFLFYGCSPNWRIPKALKKKKSDHHERDKDLDSILLSAPSDISF